MSAIDPLEVLEITIRGLSLWVPRGTFVDVLFPATRGLSIEIHDVKVSLGNGSGNAGGRRNFLLNQQVLDLRDLDPVQRTPVPLATAGFPGIPLPTDAPAAIEGVIFEDALCMAGLRLPYGTMSQHHMPLEGPFLYRGDSNTYLGHGVIWSCAYPAGTTFEGFLSDQSSPGTRQGTSLGTVDPSSRRLEIDIKCLAPEDEVSEEPMQRGYSLEDFVAYQRLTRSSTPGAPPPPDAPVYLGADTSWRSQLGLGQLNSLGPEVSPWRRKTSVRRVCGSAYAEYAHD